MEWGIAKALSSAATGGSGGRHAYKGEQFGVVAKQANDKWIWKYLYFDYTIFDLTACCFG